VTVQLSELIGVHLELRRFQMRFTQKFVLAILSAALLIGTTGGSALADTTPSYTTLSSRSATVRCANGACTLQVGLEGISPLARVAAGLGLSALQSKSGTLPAGVRVAIADDLVLTLPVGEVTLPKAQLDVEMGEHNRIARLHGTVETPFPTLGVLSDVRMVQPAVAEVGLDTGKNLSHLRAPLDPDRPYLFFNVSSGFDVAAEVADTGESLSLSAPAGQAITLVIDTQEPLVYLAGNVTVNHSGAMLLPGPLLDLAQRSPLIPDALPTWQRTQVAVSGLAGKYVEETLRLGGSWAIGAGALGSWLGVEAAPLAVEGVLTLSADGMLVDGLVRSSIEPDKLFDSSVHLTAFVPFRRDLGDAFVEAKADVAIPLAKVDTGASARLDLSQKWAAVQQGAANSAQGVKELAARGGDWLSALPDLNIARRTSGSAQLSPG
jgi:hypothetical protein